MQHELFTRVRHYCALEDPETSETKKEAIMKIDNKHRDIMYDESDEKPDEYKQDLINAIEAIQVYLKPKLQHTKI